MPPSRGGHRSRSFNPAHLIQAAAGLSIENPRRPEQLRIFPGLAGAAGSFFLS
jgi:hypothetical protein